MCKSLLGNLGPCPFDMRGISKKVSTTNVVNLLRLFRILCLILLAGYQTHGRKGAIELLEFALSFIFIIILCYIYIYIY